MHKSSRRNIALITIIFLLGLFLTACNEGTDYQGATSDPQSRTAAMSTPTPNMNMPNMNTSPKLMTERKSEAVSAPDQIVIENFSFQPATLTVKPGTKVTWINRDDVPHTANDTDKRFKSGTMDTDDKFSFTFTAPGTYNYFCALHPKMTGQVIVK